MNKTIVEYIGKGESKKVIEVKEGESVTYVLIGTKPGNKKIDIILKGRGAQIDIIGLILVKKDKVSLETLQYHLAPNTRSDLYIKSAIYDAAAFNFKGLINIAKKAQGSNAYQKNKSILMSPGAKVDTRPELEIMANDVKCTHGATVGKIDKEALFYLMSRGLTKQKAQKIFMEGFFEEALSRINDKEVKDKLSKIITKSLNV